MALVAYENSDSSEYEDDEIQSNTVIPIKKENDTLIEDPVIQNGKQESDKTHSLFVQLPQPSSKKKVVMEEDDEFLHKKELTADIKPKSRITIPSLNDFKDVDVPTSSSKTRATNGKKSSLLNMLPHPRNTLTIKRPLVPNVVAQKPNKITTNKKSTLITPTKASAVDTKGLINDNTDDSDNDEVENDFFSINKPVVDFAIDNLPLPEEETVENVQKQPRNIESYFKKDHVELQTELEVSDNVEQYDNIQRIETTEYAGVSSSNEAVLDEEAILKLCGTRGKRKREEIQLVDVNQQEVLNEARQLLMKGLMEDTSKRQSVSKKRGNEPTHQQRRKHQITYLAHQAKANESELQNQWANNRMTKRQTQSKYGF
ncbi:proline-rich protein PRCC [Vanessa cardui]|uniref:proline-rich protein PRCC n=1 Tax=Vanessa cardui TaxID=171605 RepID=UPI001F12F508|nr:proline-rich protein PRCC [Vanessa cardui]